MNIKLYAQIVNPENVEQLQEAFKLVHGLLQFFPENEVLKRVAMLLTEVGKTAKMHQVFDEEDFDGFSTSGGNFDGDEPPPWLNDFNSGTDPQVN